MSEIAEAIKSIEALNAETKQELTSGKEEGEE